MNKKIKFSLLAFMIALVWFGCKDQAVNQETVVAKPSNVEVGDRADFEGEFFGEGITMSEFMDMEGLLTSIAGQDSIKTVLHATVSEVCQAKGCWMHLVSAETGDQSVFVKFKDYGFFMPKDIAGREVLVEGYAYNEETSVDELRHYAEDAGASEEEIAAITEPKQELKFMASGVLLLNEI